MKAVCGFVAYNILDRFSEFFADRDVCEEPLLAAPPLVDEEPDNVVILWFVE